MQRINFALLCLAKFGHFDTFPGRWVGQIKIKDHLSPAEAEVGAQFGIKKVVHVYRYT